MNLQNLKNLFHRFQLKLLLMLFFISGAAVSETALDKTTVFVLSPYDQSVVVKLPQQGMQALKVGGVLKNTQATLVDVLEDRAVFEELIEDKSGNKLKEIVWLYKAVNGKSRVQRLSRQAPESSEAYTVSMPGSAESDLMKLKQNAKLLEKK